VPNSKPEAFSLSLTVQPLESGGVDAHHTFASLSDQNRAASLPGGGHLHITQALFLEALRREGFMCALAELTKDGEYVAKYVGGTPEAQAAVEQRLAETIIEMFRRGSEKLAPGIAKGILAMLSEQQGADPSS
jgi:hypothetical protein